jgi:hypothetical protein
MVLAVSQGEPMGSDELSCSSLLFSMQSHIFLKRIPHAGFLFGLHFIPEDMGDIFHQKVG